jgi:hypothetical protein
MKLVWWMLTGSVLSSLVLTILLGSRTGTEIWVGMLGPLAAALASWIAMERQHKRRPEGLTDLMIKAFVIKIIFFALYITILLSTRSVQPVPFVISFLGYFLFLYTVEAIGLRRLQAAGIAASSEIYRGQLRNG